jgi:spore coat polysaccharide biosynthesis predicted glycosyltransferase SpsG
MKKKILFRADGNSKTGLGHLYRLFALVAMYKDSFDFIFVTKATSTLKIIPKNYSIELIPDEISIKEEPKWLSKRFEPNEYIIIADGYQFVSSYQKSLKSLNYFLMYIDDLTTEYMYADIVVNHSPSVVASDFKSENYTQFALGTDYAILRPLFLDAASKTRKIDKIDTAFICFGGSDPENFTLKTINELLKISNLKLINIVLGGAYQYTSTLPKHPKIIYYKNLDAKKLSVLMQSSELAFVSSSTILYEAIATNLIIFTGYFINNQKMFYNKLHKKNIFIGLENLNKFDFNKLNRYFDKINTSMILKQIKNQARVIDGKSKSRLVQLIKN